MSADGPFWIFTGPTAVGKTSLSIELAEKLGAEIISADSRQVYRGIDVGTAKPSVAERLRVRHHFIDELDLGTPFSAGAFAEAAWARIGDILQRGKVPLVVGGSTLYLYALQFGLADLPSSEPEVRAHLNERMEAEGAETLFAELQQVDPVTADTMDATKTQRVMRALEVYHTSGKPLSHFTAQSVTPPFSFKTVVLYRPRAELYARINARVDAMLAEGLLDEARALLADGHDLTVNPLRTIGYQEPIAHLRGAYDTDEMVRLIKRNTRRYAKRQLTWFRRFPSFAWADVRDFDLQ